MMRWSECLEDGCDAPSEVIGGHESAGVDFDGREALFWMDLILCAAGHRYELIDNDRTVYLQTAIGEMFE